MADRHSLSGLTVLVLEDRWLIASQTCDVLEAAGARVLGPYAEPTAVFSSQETKPSCALLEINLGAGLDFAPARALVEQDVPIAFLTGYPKEIVPSDLAEVPFLQKPASGKRILATVEALCSR